MLGWPSELSIKWRVLFLGRASLSFRAFVGECLWTYLEYDPKQSSLHTSPTLASHVCDNYAVWWPISPFHPNPKEPFYTLCLDDKVELSPCCNAVPRDGWVSACTENMQEDLSLNPQTQVKLQVIVAHVCNPRAGKAGMRRSFGFTAVQSSLIDDLQVNERPCLKRQCFWGSSLASICCAHTYACR